MIAKTGRRGSYFTSAARLVIPNNAATTGPMQQIDAPTAARIDAAIPARVTRSSVRSFISVFSCLWRILELLPDLSRRSISGLVIACGPADYESLPSSRQRPDVLVDGRRQPFQVVAPFEEREHATVAVLFAELDEPPRNLTVRPLADAHSAKGIAAVGVEPGRNKDCVPRVVTDHVHDLLLHRA